MSTGSRTAVWSGLGLVGSASPLGYPRVPCLPTTVPNKTTSTTTGGEGSGGSPLPWRGYSRRGDCELQRWVMSQGLIRPSGSRRCAVSDAEAGAQGRGWGGAHRHSTPQTPRVHGVLARGSLNPHPHPCPTSYHSPAHQTRRHRAPHPGPQPHTSPRQRCAPAWWAEPPPLHG